MKLIPSSRRVHSIYETFTAIDSSQPFFQSTNTLNMLADKSKMRLYMPELDGLRFIAFLLVFIHHTPWPKNWATANPILTKVSAFGWIGVDIFLVLSAYLLTRLALKEISITKAFDVKRFFIRRGLRIWPLYFFALFLGLFLYPTALGLLGYDTKITAMLWDHLIPFSLFLGNFSYAAFSSTLGEFRSLWTISLEEQFYFIFPVLILAVVPLRKSRLVTIGVIIAAVAILVRSYMEIKNIPYPWVWVMPFSRLDPFLVGIGLAVLEDRSGRMPVSAFVACAVAGSLLLLITTFPQIGKSAHTIWQLTASAVASGALLVLARQGFSQKLLSARVIVALGKLSFGLYVYHRFSLDILKKTLDAFGVSQNGSLGWLLFWICSFFLTICAALFSYRYLERFFLKKKIKFENIQSRSIELYSRPLASIGDKYE